MAKTKPLRKRDILIFVVAIAAVALIVFGATQLVEHFSKRTNRDTRPIDPNATTSAPETEPEIVTPDTTIDPEPLAVTTAPTTEAEPSETAPVESEDPDTTSAPSADAPATTTSAKVQALTMPEDTGKPADAKSKEELEEELEEIADSYASNGYNNNIKNFVLIGVDKEALYEYDLFRFSGQSDVIMVLSLNMKTKEYWFVTINRDLSVPVENYSMIGESYGFVDEQIALAYCYGDGSRLSGQNVVKSVRYLFDNRLPFIGFIAVPRTFISILADAVDGVPIEIQEDLTAADPEFVKGANLVLRGEQAERFVRSRMILGHKNVHRISREIQFCEAFIKKAKSTMTAKQLVAMYEDLMGVTWSDMGKADVTKWILTAYDYTLKGFYRIDGVLHEGDYKHNAIYFDVVQSEVDDVAAMYFK